jgi:hypothetical protein
VAVSWAAVPTVLRSGPYRFFFFAGDRDEPRHVHVERDDCIAKFWLSPVRLASSGGFGPPEVRRLSRIVTENREALVRCWDDFFGS